MNAPSSGESQFEVFEFIEYLRGRWRFPAIACIVAVAIALAAAFALPNEYTATASILIESPAGNDPRASTAVSPVYLESLRTYEHFALSDSLFVEALDRLGIRQQYTGVAIESLKRRVLKVSKPRDTKILEISATLKDPVKAQSLAQYIAQKTVALSSSLDQQSEDDLAGDTRKLADAASQRLARADDAWVKIAASEPIETLQSQIESATDSVSRLHRDLLDARADLAGYMAQQTAGSEQNAEAAKQIASQRARIAEMERDQTRTEASLEQWGKMLEQRKANHDNIELERKAARTEFETTNARLGEMKSSVALRGERLKIIDPGIVPQRPSSPNIPVIGGAALLIALAGSLVYLAIGFSYAKRKVFEPERSYSTRY